jgi:[ribosomal protein S5]-alanine N-acetyltransferase
MDKITALCPLIRTPRMTLRPPEASDAAAYEAAYEASRDFWRPWTPTIDVDAETSFSRLIDRHEKGMRDGTQFRLLGFVSDGRLAAIVGLSEVVRGAFECAYAGWRISAPLCNQGLATESVTALLDFAYAPPPHGLALHRVQANVRPDNVPSLRVAEKAGFRREGLALRYLQIAGRWEDHVMFAKLSDEHRRLYLLPDPG